MAALGTFTGASELEELVPTELIDDYVAGSNFAPTVGKLICRIKAGKGSIPVKLPRFNAVSSVPAGTKTESDTFTDVNIDTDESSVTPGIVGLRIPISEEALVQTVMGPAIERAILDEVIRAVEDRIDSDILSPITSATNTVGAATDNFTMAKVWAALAAYRALKIAPGPLGTALLLHDDGFRDLEVSLGETTATLTPTAADEVLFGPTTGYHGTYHGLQILSSPNAPANASNWSGCVTPIGDNVSGLAYVQAQPVRVVISEGDDAKVRAVLYAIVRAWYGTGIGDPNKILEVLHRT
jgi:hypothetical protein